MNLIDRSTVLPSFKTSQTTNRDAGSPFREEHFRQVVRSSPALIWFSDERGHAEFVNDRWSAFTGLGSEDLLGDLWQQIIHPDDQAKATGCFQDGIAQDGPSEVEIRFRRQDGEYRWHVLRAVPLQNGDGTVRGFFGTAADIHESKTLRDQLRWTNERLLMAHQAARAATWEWNLVTQQVFWTDLPSARSLFGDCLPDKNPLTFEEWLGLTPAEDHPSAFAQIAASLPLGEGRLEFRVLIDGSYSWFEARGRVVETNQAGIPLLIMGVTTDITERKKREQHHLLLINELNHRVKNTLATVQSLAAQSLQGTRTSDDARTSFTSRLMALARAHDVLTRESWEGADLADIVSGALEPYQNLSGERLRTSGDRLRLHPRSALAIAMALHELATNAVKYGALSTDTGRIAIVWTVAAEGAGKRLRIVWTEEAGPPVTAPAHRGFGSRLIEKGLAGELNGEARIDYRPDGVVCTIDAVLQELPSL